MAVKHSTRMIPSDDHQNWPLHTDPINDISSDGIRALLNLKRQNLARDPKGMVPSRSGSAPPSFEGSFAAIQNFMDQQNSRVGVATPTTSSVFDGPPEERLLSDPAYITYYYSHVNLNPRLPPPRLSRENRHLLRHNENWRLSSFEDNGALLAPPGFLSTHREEREEDISSAQALNDQSEDSTACMTRQQLRASLAGYTESIVDLMQDSISQSTTPALTVSHPESSKENIDCSGRAITLTDHSSQLTELTSSSTISLASSSHRLSDPCPNNKNADAEDGVPACSVPGSEVAGTDSRMKSLNVSDSFVSGRGLKKHEELQFHEQTRQLHRAHHDAYSVQTQVISQGVGSLNNSIGGFSMADTRSSGIKATMLNPELVSPCYATAGALMNSGNPLYAYVQQASMLHPQFSLGGCTVRSPFYSPYIGGYPSQSMSVTPLDSYTGLSLFGQAVATTNPLNGAAHYLNSLYGRALHPSFANTLQGQYFEQPLIDISRDLAHYNQMIRHQAMWGQKSMNAFAGDTKPELIENRNSSTSSHGKFGVNSSNYYGHPNYSFMTQFPVSIPLPPGSPMAATNHSAFGDHASSSPGSYKNLETYSGIKGPKASDIGSTDDSKRRYFLEVLKSNNSRKLELSDIAGQIVYFSIDQHGSRFIQQKLDHSSVEDKELVFKEVLPHASKLMTDVFGNYVIQKLFEHGSSEQRRKLADQLTGQILSLSLQMYGCRVIQKALEVIELDQKVKLVQELDGHVTRCVSDQNGNHVIQKCIESIPAKKIAFIISAFHGQVATLSTHPYGCRVIQRVLEHCSEDSVSQCVVDEILESACTLAEDQYGNYVTQHVLEMGKPQERSQIISKLDGKFVQMSQHKYASNVVEKCLKCGDSSERKLLIDEIIGPSNDDDSLLTMMKDQYANYVVQRILELANEKQRESFLNRIKHHITALKKYTFGKHIVARYEKLLSSPDDNAEGQSS